MVDEPIQFQLSADLDVEELVVLENEVRGLSGTRAPGATLSSLPIGEEGEERKITVRAIDSSGEVSTLHPLSGVSSVPGLARDRAGAGPRRAVAGLGAAFPGTVWPSFN